jgi:uncharacterized Zn-binding protein involved in type VI secretion
MINAPATAVIRPDLALPQAMMCLLRVKPSTASKINGPCMRALIRRLMMACSLKGSSTVYVNGKAIARIGDPISCGSKTQKGSQTVFAG